MISCFLILTLLISDRQHGFTKNRSTVTNLLAADSILADWTNDSVSYDILSFDFSRAFDSVPHDLLIEQLATYNLHSQSLKWFKSFLTSRCQQVRVKDALSNSTGFYLELYKVPFSDRDYSIYFCNPFYIE